MSTLKLGKLENLGGVEQYTCKAWVNFNGTGTVAIRAAGNVSSITDNGTGDYTVNLANAMSDTNYCVLFGVNQVGKASAADSTLTLYGINGSATLTTTSFRVAAEIEQSGPAYADPSYCFISVFR